MDIFSSKWIDNTQKEYKISNWKNLGILNELNDVTNKCGIYKITCISTDKVMYVGEATELNRGLRKRLNDYIRTNDSGRKTDAGRKIYKFREKLNVEIKTIEGSKHLRRFINIVEKTYILKLNPTWNKN